MTRFNGRWLKRTLAIAGPAAMILVGTALLILMLQDHFGSGFLDTSDTNFNIVLLSLYVIVAGVSLLVWFNREPDPTETSFSGVRVNVLCLMGAILGFFCMVMVHWASGGYMEELRPDPPLWLHADWMIHPPLESFEMGAVYSWFFVVGTVMAFFSPLAGYLQLCGVTLFAMKLGDILNGPAGTGSWAAPGLAFAIVGTSMVLISFAFPYGVGYRGEPIDLTGRILTVSSSGFAERIRRWRHHESPCLRSADSRQ